MNISKRFFIFFLIFTSDTFAQITNQNEIGFKSGLPVLTESWGHIQFYGETDTKMEWPSGQNLFSLRFDVFGSGIQIFNGNETLFFEFEPKEVGLSFSNENYRFALGYQNITWGQTFAFSVTDLVNSKDFRDPFELNPRWKNRSTFMLTGEYFFEEGSLQFIFTPFPRNNKYPTKDSPYSLFQNTRYRVSNPNPFDYSDLENSEFGGRINKLIKGWDLSFFFFRHWTRQQIYSFSFDSFGVLVSPLRSYGTTYGFGFSTETGEFIQGSVIRGDFVFHPQSITPKSDGFGFYVEDTVDAVLALDWSWGTGWTLMFQPFAEFKNGQINKNLSFQIEKKIEESFQISIMAVKEISKESFWLQPQIVYFPSGDLTMKLQLDVTQNQYFSKQDRFLTTLLYQF